MRSLKGSTVRAGLRSRALPQVPFSTSFGRQRSALPLFAGTRSLQVPGALESRSSRGVYLFRQYSSGTRRGGCMQLGAPKFSLSFGSVLLASTLGAMAFFSQRIVRAKENTSDRADDEDEDEDKEEKQNKEDFVHYLLERPILLLLLEREDVDEKLDKNLDEILEDEELKAVHLLDYQFFSSDKSKFPTNATALVYHYNQKTKQVEAYVYPADKELTADNIKQFLSDIKEHKLEELRYHPSEPRPAEDKHPTVKHLKVVTAESFKDMVLESDKDVLVYLHIPSTTTPTDLQVLANAYAGKDDIVIAECTSFLNELDPTYFGDSPIEGVKLFVKGHKQTPITYHGKGDLLDIVAFVEQQRGADGEQLYRQLRKADATRLIQDFEKTLGDYYLHSIAYKEFVPVSEKAKGLFNRLFDMYDQINISEDPFKTNAATLKRQLRDELKALEHATLRNVKLVEKEKYQEELAEARKKGEVVVFFWRKGCWPCKKLSPMIGQLSLDFPEVTFIKVDADVEGLNATPTFFVYREEDDQPSELSGMKLISHLHPLARKRGLPGYAKWLPPAERAKLVEPSPDEIERSSEEVPPQPQENSDKDGAKTEGQQDEAAASQDQVLAPTDDEVTSAAAAAATSATATVESLQKAELPHHQHHQ